MGEVILLWILLGFVGFFFIINLIWNFDYDLLINFIFLLLFVIFLKIEDG